MAGIGWHKDKITALFEDLGACKDRILVTSDGSLALQLLPHDGAILIAGTGSVCLGKKDGKRYIVGGLGYLLGDGGNGYAMGIQALRASLEHEFGWGKQTNLTSELRLLYGVPNVEELMRNLYNGTLTPAQIGQAAPLVFTQAILKEDLLAITILNEAADQLSNLINTMITLTNLYDCEIHLWGGLFKNKDADIFIKKIERHSIIQQHHITLINKASENMATLLGRYIIKIASGSDFSWKATIDTLTDLE